MIFTLLIILSAISGGIGRRIAGGVLNEWAGLAGGINARVMGDTPARLIYGASLAMAAFVGGAGWWLALATVLTVWVGTTTGNFGSISMGRAPGHSIVADWFGMMAHAALSAVTPALTFGVAAYFGHAPALAWLTFAWICTLSASPAYDFGWRLSGLATNSRFPLGFRNGWTIGEFIWGGACGVGMFLAFAV